MSRPRGVRSVASTFDSVQSAEVLHVLCFMLYASLVLPSFKLNAGYDVGVIRHKPILIGYTAFSVHVTYLCMLGQQSGVLWCFFPLFIFPDKAWDCVQFPTPSLKGQWVKSEKYFTPPRKSMKFTSTGRGLGRTRRCNLRHNDLMWTPIIQEAKTNSKQSVASLFQNVLILFLRGGGCMEWRYASYILCKNNNQCLEL